MLECEKALLFEKIRLSGEAEVRVGGYCMKPVIYNGASVTIHPIVLEELCPGEIVAYFIDLNLYVHRLVAKEKETLVLQADNKQPDIHSIPVSSVLGKVVKIKNPSLIARICTKLRNYTRLYK